MGNIRTAGLKTHCAMLMAGTAGLAAMPALAQGFTQPTTVSPAGPGEPAVPAPAAAAPGDQAGLGEIIVTAQKRAQNLQDIGVSVTALGGEALKLVQRNDPVQLVNAVPSLQINQYSPSLIVFNIRGVSQNDFSNIQEAPIAYYNDEAYIGSTTAISGMTFDLERVEVLRGPQGTLFGRNATGGLIQQISAKPTDRLDGYVTLGGGSYGQFTTEAAIGGGLAPGVRGRLSFTSDRRDAYYKQANPAVRPGGSGEFYGARAQLEFDTPNNGNIRFKAEYLRNVNESDNQTSGAVARPDADGLGVAVGRNENAFGTGPGANPLGFRPSSNPYRSNFDTSGYFDRKYFNSLIRYEQDLGFASLTSLTSYQKLRSRNLLDVDGTPDKLIQPASTVNATQVSQELRLAGKSSAFDWVVGAYALQIKTRYRNEGFFDPVAAEAGFAASQGLPAAFFIPDGATAGNGFDPRPGFGTVGAFASDNLQQVRQNTRSVALFGQGEYRVTSKLSAILGARYSDDSKTFLFSHADRTSFNPAIGFPTYDPSAPYVEDFRYQTDGKKHFRNWSGKAELDFKPNRDTLIYISANRGTKAGGFNTAVVIVPTTPRDTPFKQEVLTNYEGGFKLKLFDNKATFNTSVFHYVYHNYQAFQNINASQVITNVPARVTGLEVELAARPTRNLTLTGFATHLFQREVRDIALPISGRVTNRQLPGAPRWSLGGTAAYGIPFGDTGTLTLAGNVKYNSAQYYEVFNAPVDRQKAYAIGNLRASFSPPSGVWEAAVFVNNVTDKRYLVHVSDNASTTYTAEVNYARPRWFGGQVTYRFGK